MSTLRQRRESTDEKAARLLTTGRLTVVLLDDDTIMSECQGDHGTYRQTYFGGRWECSCPARTDCAHLRALWLVTVKPREEA